MILPCPENVILFSVETSQDLKDFDWKDHEPIVKKLLKVPKAFQSELRRLFLANCFQTKGKLMCNFEIFHSITRLLFSLSREATAEDWPLIKQIILNNPPMILSVIGLEVTQFLTHNQFCAFTLDGISPDMALDLASIGQAAAHFSSQFIVTKNQPLQLL